MIQRMTGWQIVKAMRERGITQTQIAAKAGTHASVVSRVIRRRPGVGEATAKAVWLAIENAVENGGTR